jgi:hypothetical protein
LIALPSQLLAKATVKDAISSTAPDLYRRKEKTIAAVQRNLLAIIAAVVGAGAALSDLAAHSLAQPFRKLR